MNDVQLNTNNVCTSQNNKLNERYSQQLNRDKINNHQGPTIQSNE